MLDFIRPFPGLGIVQASLISALGCMKTFIHFTITVRLIGPAILLTEQTFLLTAYTKKKRENQTCCPSHTR